jgi:trehalose 6-phosphate phosphatase
MPPELTPILSRLQRTLDGAVAVLTGRKIEEVDRLLTPLRLTAGGVHGNELRLEPEGEIEIGSGLVSAPLAAAVERLAHSMPGVMVEQKGISIAVHYRAVPELEPALNVALRGLLDHHSSRLVLSHGRRVFELVPPGATKGTALRELMERPRFRRRRPVMIGDDQPDETALQIAKELGGLGLKVSGEHFQGGATHFSGPAQVRGWLHELAEKLDT